MLIKLFCNKSLTELSTLLAFDSNFYDWAELDLLPAVLFVD